MKPEVLIFVGIAATVLLLNRKQTQQKALNLTAQQRAQLQQQCTFSGIGKLLGGFLSSSATRAQRQQQSPSGGSKGGGGGSPSPGTSGGGKPASQGPPVNSGDPCHPVCVVCHLCFNNPCITPCTIPNNPTCFNSPCITPCNTPNAPATPCSFPATPGCCGGSIPQRAPVCCTFGGGGCGGGGFADAGGNCCGGFSV